MTISPPLHGNKGQRSPKWRRRSRNREQECLALADVQRERELICQLSQLKQSIRDLVYHIRACKTSVSQHGCPLLLIFFFWHQVYWHLPLLWKQMSVHVMTFICLDNDAVCIDMIFKNNSLQKEWNLGLVFIYKGCIRAAGCAAVCLPVTLFSTFILKMWRCADDLIPVEGDICIFFILFARVILCKQVHYPVHTIIR